MAKDTMRELVQVALSTPATANLSGPRATVDSRAAPRLATSPVEELPVVVAVEDSMVESVNEWDCIMPQWTSPAFGCSESLGNHHQIIDTWRKETMFRDKTNSGNLFRCRYGLAAFIAAIIVVTVFSFLASAQDTKQKKFKSPEDAFKSLVEAAKNNDTKELLAIFGPEGKDIISSGDEVADRGARKRFVKAAKEAVKFSKLDDETMLPVIGKDERSFPIPIVKSGQEWVFSTEEGKEEIINRRIGRNELYTIRVSLAYVDAQREYASKDHNGDGVLQYAQHFVSQKGKKDGLYWEAAPGEKSSPLGPLVASATKEGYTARKGEKPSPYHGYYFKILKSQGSSAPGGELDYVINGKMVAGFGLVAYPAEYGVSGIMTFTVNQLGIVFEKDLGPKTEEIAKAITKYDPDKTWNKME
jgi:hypothetical protein